ncbi:MAG: nuclear transport factor 2 family protein [Synechococcus sp.]|nr:nuclear transport factor 2 family protein [Synechococcus sp.]
MSAADYDMVANTISRYFIAVDECDWSGVSKLMTNPFHLDCSSFGGGDPSDLPPQSILAGWRALLPGFEHTHHQIGNLVVEIDGEIAEASCMVLLRM